MIIVELVSLWTYVNCLVKVIILGYNAFLFILFFSASVGFQNTLMYFPPKIKVKNRI